MKNNFDKLQIGNKSFNSRLMLGTGKYRTVDQAISSINNSECEIVTVAIRRLPTNLHHDNTTFLKFLTVVWVGFFISTKGLENISGLSFFWASK